VNCRECSRDLELKSKKNKETGMYYQEWECIACGVTEDPTGMKNMCQPTMVSEASGDLLGALGYSMGIKRMPETKIEYVPGYGFKVLEDKGFTLADCFKKGKI
jgi:hypothetical protein